MSFEATKWAWKVRCKPIKKLVLLALADRANTNNQCFPSIDKLADDTGAEIKSISKAIKEMEREGYITIKKTCGMVNQYTLNIEITEPKYERNEVVITHKSTLIEDDLEGGSISLTTPKNGGTTKNDTTPKNGGRPPPKTGVDHPQKRGTNLSRTYKEPKRIGETPTPPSKNKISLEAINGAISEAAALGFIEHRKAIKKPLTQYAFDLAMREAMKAPTIGMTPTEAIEETIIAGWAGIKIDYLKNRASKKNETHSRYQSNHQRASDKIDRDFESSAQSSMG